MALHVGVQDSLIPLGHPGAHAASMRSESWIVVVTLLGSGACGPDVVGEATAGVDESTADDDGADDTQGDDGPESTGDETGAVDDRWQLCDDAAMPEPPEDAGPCAGRVPAGALDDVQAEAIFGRATHELDHLGDVVQGRALDGGLFERDGDDIWALTDSGYVVGRIAREDSTGRACVRVAFAWLDRWPRRLRPECAGWACRRSRRPRDRRSTRRARAHRRRRVDGRAVR